MPTGSNRLSTFSPETYWMVREGEIKRKLLLLHTAIDQCERARTALLAVSETAKLNSEEWDTAQATAMSALRKARGHKTGLRRMVGLARDTIRIRPAYARAIGEGTKTILDTASRLCEYLDASGY